ncbi:VRR-NUC domain endonuclease [Aminobacter phage Erebus]|nr:VRR-NUC domain endonuclease [Aminobacter phage Erebus]
MGDDYDDQERRMYRTFDRVEKRLETKMARKPKASIEGTKPGQVGITPEMLAASGTEHGHQCAIFQWIAMGGARTYAQCMDLVFAVPNGGDRQAHVGAAMRAEGVKPGVPDMCWPVPKMMQGSEGLDGIMRYAGLYIELKTPKRHSEKNGGRQDTQVKWQKRLLEQGYAVVTAYGWQAACWALVAYWEGNLAMPSDGDCLMALPVDAPPTTTGR